MTIWRIARWETCRLSPGREYRRLHSFAFSSLIPCSAALVPWTLMSPSWETIFHTRRGEHLADCASGPRSQARMPSLSSSRFLKTILVRHAYGLLVVKLFIKPDPMMSLRLIQRRLKSMLSSILRSSMMLTVRSADQRDALSSISHTLSYSTFVETEKAGYLIRQWAGASLYDRIRQVQIASPRMPLSYPFPAALDHT